jgi:hypothetical protein
LGADHPIRRERPEPHLRRASIQQFAWLEIGIGAALILAGSAYFVFGYRRLHGKLNLTSARDGSGWVGHSGLRSVQGSSIVFAAVAAIIILQLVVH